MFQLGFVKETTDIRSAASEGKIFRIEDFPQQPPSVFTNRTGYAQPRWATKYFFLPQPNKTAGDKSVCFVHVGKTAGTTIACYLGFRYRSEQAFVMPQGRLRDNTVHAFHNWVNDCPDDDDYYLFATRDPISRIMSWFTYERPINNFNWAPGEEGMQQKRLFIDCPFPHLNDLAEKGLGDPKKNNISKICRQRAFDAVRGYQNFYRHNFYNYDWYLRHVPQEKPLLALRQEFLAQDWMSAESVLAKQANDSRVLNITFPHRNKSLNVTKADKYLSETATKNLCQVLCMDIQAYKNILQRSVNLSPQDFEASMNMLAEHCPSEARSWDCDLRLFPLRGMLP